jgi:hypothetical protein
MFMMTVLRSNEDVTDFLIGKFDDLRLRATGGLLFKRICHKITTCVKNLGETRAMQVAFERFLHNPRTSAAEIAKSLCEQTNQRCIGRAHVLAIGDTVENTFPGHKIKKDKFGTGSHSNIKCFFGHPVVIVDAQSKDMLGLGSIETWTRTKEPLAKNKPRPIEEKESMKWLTAAANTAKYITNPDKITMVYDREGDIYELFDRRPSGKIELLVRSDHDRKIQEKGMFLSEYLREISVAKQYDIELPPITGKRTARTATMVLKFTTITMLKPGHLTKYQNKAIEVTCVEATEISVPPNGEAPIYWRILTTHDVTNAEEAMKIVTWYTWRWSIEQIFRTNKTKGLDIESSQIEEPAALFKLFVLSLAAAVKVMSLVHARDGLTKRPASDIFSETEIKVLERARVKVEGKTVKQQNPFSLHSLSWAAWIIARLGGWMGYQKASPPGPITMYRGLQVLDKYMDAWALFNAEAESIEIIETSYSTAPKDVCIG